jgi:uncharacterized protein with GYD domain
MTEIQPDVKHWIDKIATVTLLLPENEKEGESNMAYYLQLMVLTDKGRQNFDENPEWIREIDKIIELSGVKILTQYALLGQYDFVNIIEAPSDEVAAKLSLKLSAIGAFQPTTLAAIPLSNLIDSLKKEQKRSSTNLS